MTQSPYMLGKSVRQGNARRVLFVCHGGILRSATAAQWAFEHKRWNTRSCGCLVDAVPQCSLTLFEWAERIYCMESKQADLINEQTQDKYLRKIRVMHISDDYDYRQPALVAVIAQVLEDE